jgi:hypothetical protein
MTKLPPLTNAAGEIVGIRGRGYRGKPMGIDEMPAGVRMDILIAERVLGQVPCDKWRYFHGDRMVNTECEHECYPRGRPCEYSTRISAAWQVDRTGWVWTFTERPGNVCAMLYPSMEWWAAAEEWHGVPKGVVWAKVGQSECDTKAERYALARCRAALKAVEAQT